MLKERGVLRGGMPVSFGNGASGVITSGSFSPTLKYSVALARVDRHAEGDAQVNVRNRSLSVEVVKPSFVRNGKALV